MCEPVAHTNAELSNLKGLFFRVLFKKIHYKSYSTYLGELEITIALLLTSFYRAKCSECEGVVFLGVCYRAIVVTYPTTSTNRSGKEKWTENEKILEWDHTEVFLYTRMRACVCSLVLLLKSSQRNLLTSCPALVQRYTALNDMVINWYWLYFDQQLAMIKTLKKKTS